MFCVNWRSDGNAMYRNQEKSRNFLSCFTQSCDWRRKTSGGGYAWVLWAAFGAILSACMSSMHMSHGQLSTSSWSFAVLYWDEIYACNKKNIGGSLAGTQNAIK